MYITNANTDLLPHLSEAHSIDTHPLARKPRTIPARIRLMTAHMPMRTHTPSPAPTDHDAAFITSSTYVFFGFGMGNDSLLFISHVLHLSALVSTTRLRLANI
ncbi:hypothetical protein M405DRAFT_833497, partial [Rhizopogon salebrosus TDB-379]